MKTTVRCSVLCLALLLIVSLTALAANDNEILTTKDGRQTFVSKPGAQSVPLQTNPFLGLKIIYNNFNFNAKHPSRLYYGRSGYSIMGSGALFGTTIGDGMPFTPKADVTVTKIGVAVGYVTGAPDEVTVSLNADNNGLPGDSLGSFNVSGLPSLGSCCQIEVGSLSVAITAGTQYWVVVLPTDPNSDTWAAWNENNTNLTPQQFANYSYGAWEFVDGYVFSAFAVAGK